MPILFRPAAVFLFPTGFTLPNLIPQIVQTVQFFLAVMDLSQQLFALFVEQLELLFRCAVTIASQEPLHKVPGATRVFQILLHRLW